MANYDPVKFPTLAALMNSSQATKPAEPRNFIAAGVSAGADEFQALSGRGVQALGDAVGSRSISDFGAGIAERNFEEAAQNGRADLEGGIFDQGLMAAPQRLGYQAAKQLPTLAAALISGWALKRPIGALVPAEGALASAGAAVPKFLGGGGLRAGATALERKAAMEAGRDYVAGTLGAAPVLYPQSVGSMYDEAVTSGNNTPSNAIASLGLGVPYSLMESLEPSALKSFVKRGAEGNIAKRIFTSALGVAPTEAVTEGVQTGMEQSFRPDLTPREKADNIVQAMVTGGLVGGLFGGVAGAISPRIKTTDANNITDDDLTSVVDEALAPKLEPTGQYTMPGMEQRGPSRPFEKASDEELQTRLADLQQRTATDNRRDASMFNSSFLPEGSVERAGTAQDAMQMQLLRQEIDRRAGVAPVDQAPDFTTGARAEVTNFPVGAQGEFDRAVQGPFRMEETAPGLVTPPVREEMREPSPTVEQPGQFNLFGADRNALPYRQTPAAAREDAKIVSDEQVKSAQLTNTVIGEGKSMWQKALREMPAADTTDVATNVMSAIAAFGDKKPPEGLINTGKALGLLDATGMPRDINAELQAAETKYANMWRRAKEDGKGEKQAVEFKKNTLTKLREAKATFDAVQQRMAERQANAKPAATPAAQPPVTEAPNVDAPTGQAFASPIAPLKLDVKQENRAVSEGDTEWLAKQQKNASLQPDGRALKGSLTAWTTKPVELPLSFLRQLPSVTPTTDSKIERLEKRVAKVGWKPQPITVKVNHRGEAFIENGNARLIVARGEGESSIPVNIEWMNGAEISDTPWSPNRLYQFAQEGVRPPAAPETAQASPENIKYLRQAETQKKRLERIAKSDMVGVDLQTAASEALAGLESNAPNATEIAQEVLQQASGRTISYATPTGNPTAANNALSKAAEKFKTAEDAARWLAAHAENSVIRLVMRKILPALDVSPLYIVKNGDTVPKEIFNRLDTDADGLYSANYDTGERAMYVRADRLDEGLLAHELLHAAVNTRIYEGRQTRNQGTELAKTVQELLELRSALVKAYNEMNTGRTNPEFVNSIAVRASLSPIHPSEVITYAFTDAKVQSFMRAVPYKTGTMWSKFVSLVRNLFGIPASEESALAQIIDITERLVNIPLNAQQANANPEVQETLAWSDERLEGELRNHHYNDGRAKAWVAWVDPREFLDATTYPDLRKEIEAKRGKYDSFADMAAKQQTPFLQYQNGRVTDHEGRHRMAMLVRMGVKSVPIVVTDFTGAKRKPMANMTLKPQGHPDGQMSSGSITLNDLIPLNRQYEDAIKERMGNREVTYALATPNGLEQNSQRLSSMADQVKARIDKANFAELSLKGNQFNLYTSTVTHIAGFYRKLFDVVDAAGNVIKNGLRMFDQASRARDVTEQRLAHLVQRALEGYDTLKAAAPKMAANVEKLMGYTVFNIDPRKTWDEQTWLHGLRNSDVLKRHATEANALYRKMSQIAKQDANKGQVTAFSVYNDFININEAMHFAQQAVSLYNLLTTDEGVLQQTKDELRDQNPMDVFLNAGGSFDSPAAARKYWFDATNALVANAKSYLDRQYGATETDAAMRTQIAAAASSLQSRLNDINSQQQSMARAPYFHIGRFGDYVLKFNIKRTDQGVADPAAMERIAKAFDDAGITGIEIPEVERANAYIRFEKWGARDEALKVARILAKEGVISDVEHLDRKNENYGDPERASPIWVQRLMNHLRTSPATENFKLPGVDEKMTNAINAAFERNVQQFFLNMLPDISVNKVMVHRNSVPGFSSDMVRSFVFRTQVGGRALANLHASAKMADATDELVRVAKDARASDDPKQAQIKANVVTELLKREAQRPQIVKNDYIDTLRAANHSYFLGLAPAHFIVNTTQVGVMLWPELSKRFGFVNSARGIAKVTPQAFNIMRAVISTAAAKGLKHIPDASITPEVLEKAGVDKATAAFIMRVVNSGRLDIGSQSREQGRIAEGRNDSKTEKVLEWASTTGYYSEMLTRLVSALSARELYGDKPGLNDYVDETIDQSMFSFQTWNQARAVGRMGMAGQFTPIMTSLMQYQFQATEKLIRELANAFGARGATDAEKAESRRFLGAHLAAVTVVAGSLGLPSAAIFAALFDKLKDLFYPDDEPSDIQSAYRGWLANMVGKDVAEVLARGVPRALPMGLGVDISQRAGEQNFLPFGHMMAKLLTDKREWKDVLSGWALDTLGAPTSMIGTLMGSGNLMLQGKFKEAMTEGLPLALRGPVKAWRMTEEGYTDGKGNKLPMTPTAGATLAQALGFNPAPKAEYSEARATQSIYKGQLLRRAADIRNRLIKALEQGDMETAREYYAKAAQFGIDNPSFQILPTLASTIAARQKATAVSKATGSPLGVKPELAARTNWANFGN